MSIGRSIRGSKEIAKGLRFGLNNSWEGNPTPAEKIFNEFSDMISVFEMLRNEGVFSNVDTRRSCIPHKKYKVNKFMDYARSIGTLEKEDNNE